MTDEKIDVSSLYLWNDKNEPKAKDFSKFATPASVHNPSAMPDFSIRGHGPKLKKKKTL